MILRAVPLGGPGSALPAGVCSAGELERARAILDPARRHAFLAGRLALRALVAEALGVDPAELRPGYACPECGPGEHGAPGFTLAGGDAHDGGWPGHADDGGPHPRVSLAASMSRAGGWALLAAEVGSRVCEVGSWVREVGPWVHEVGSRDREVGPPGLGVDLALVADFRRAIPEAAYSAAERRRLLTAEDPAAEAARLWARKEALLKALGTGLRADPAELETLGDPRVADLDPASLGLPPGFAAATAGVSRDVTPRMT